MASFDTQGLLRLVNEGVRESRTLEFKRQLPGSADGKRKFRQSVTSFANTLGGTILIGVDESNGVASRIVPIQPEFVDEAKRWIESVSLTNISPRLAPGPRISEISVGGGVVLAIEIARSLAAPHAVVQDVGWFGFSGRGDGGKVPWDMDDLRRAFWAPRAIRWAKRLRKRRLRLLRGRTAGGPLWVLHLVPLKAAFGIPFVDVRGADAVAPGLLLPNNGPRFNADGVTLTDGSVAQFQLFRDGVMELRLQAAPPGKSIPGGVFAGKIDERFESWLRVAPQLGIHPPHVLFLSLIDCRGIEMAGWPGQKLQAIDRDAIHCYPILVEEEVDDVRTLLAGWMDMIWNAVGLPEAPARQD